MKTIKYIIAFTAFLMLSSCSLKENNVSYSTRDSYYRSEVQVRTGLSGCYNPARTIYVNVGFWQMTECTTDLIYMSGSTQYNADCDVSPSRPGVSSTVWSY